MNQSEAAVLLAMMAAYDRRTIGETDAMAWASALNDIRLEDAQFVANEHYRQSTDWLMPAHIVAGVKRLRRDRLERCVPMPDADPDDVQEWLTEYRRDIRDIGDGHDLPEKRNEVEGRQQRDMRVIEGTFRRVDTA